jgi:hypothetical protein
MIAGVHLCSTLFTSGSAATPAANSSAISLLSDSTKTGALFWRYRCYRCFSRYFSELTGVWRVVQLDCCLVCFFRFCHSSRQVVTFASISIVCGNSKIDSDVIIVHPCENSIAFLLRKPLFLPAAIPSLRCKVPHLYIPVLRTLA